MYVVFLITSKLWLKLKYKKDFKQRRENLQTKNVIKESAIKHI